MSITEILWPDLDAVVGSYPEPVTILRNQGTALKEITGGRLYGEVLEGEVSAADGVQYDFYIGVTDRPFRYLLLSTQCGFLFDYPASIVNPVAGTAMKAEDTESFKEQVRLILMSPETKELLRRMLSFAVR